MGTETNETGIENSLLFYLNVSGSVFLFISCWSHDQTTVRLLHHNLHLCVNAYLRPLEKIQGWVTTIPKQRHNLNVFIEMLIFKPSKIDVNIIKWVVINNVK